MKFYLDACRCFKILVKATIVFRLNRLTIAVTGGGHQMLSRQLASISYRLVAKQRPWRRVLAHSMPSSQAEFRGATIQSVIKILKMDATVEF